MHSGEVVFHAGEHGDLAVRLVPRVSRAKYLATYQVERENRILTELPLDELVVIGFKEVVAKSLKAVLAMALAEAGLAIDDVALG